MSAPGTQDCPDCEATGRQMVHGRDQDGAPWADFTREHCRTCCGKGTVLADPLPCPFCGGAAEHRNDGPIICPDCAVSMEEGEGPAAVVAAWNRRTPLWQPIATAPRDALILVYAPPYQNLFALLSPCHWEPEVGFCIDELRQPTHWIPLPDAPVTP